MRKTTFVVLLALAVLAAAACNDNLTSPTAGTVSKKSNTALSDTTTKAMGFVGTWQATKAEGSSALIPGSRRDLVAEGGTVTLVLEGGQMEAPPNWPRYTITVTMPEAKPGVDTGRWIYHEFWGKPQIDFYPSSIPDPEYGEIPAFLVALSDNTLTLWDSGLTFLPFDFGWNDPPGTHSTVLNLVFTRK